MKTIKSNSQDELTINKSRFIGYLYKVNNKDEINSILDKLKDEYYDATHICYAYILENSQKAYDDNEPNKTAGLPILEVLKKNDLVYVLGVVIRYFGGIKLGSNGLIRAYSKTIRNTLEKNEIKDLKKGYLIKISFNYNNEKLINNLLEKYEIINKIFDKDITYSAKIDDELLIKLKEIKQDYEIIEEIYL